MGDISFKKDATFGKCPECNSVGKLRRSHAKSPFEQFVKKLGIFKYYRCKECGWRGAKLGFGFGKVSIKTVLLYLGLMLATAVIVKFVVQKMAMK